MKRLDRTLWPLAVLGVVVLVFGLMSPLVSVRADPTVPTTAQVVPGAQPPVIEWKWELPDMNSAVPGIQYIPSSGADIHDDDAAVPANPPTDLSMMHVTPNLDDQPEMKLIEYWAAVQDPNGIADIINVWVDVFEPAPGGGTTLKYQLYMQKVACADLGTRTTVGTMLEAATHSGQMNATEADLIVELCQKNDKAIYKVVGDLSKEQPSGQYLVEVTAVDQSGAATTMRNGFIVISVIGLQIDFSSINWGNIVPNTKKWLSGDYNFNPPNDARPTVKNVGNDPMKLGLLFSKMLGQTFGKEIIQFDAQLDPSPLGGADVQVIDPIAAGVPVTFTTVLTSNQLGQLDLSIQPGAIPADIYRGTLQLTGSK